jgi:hypothetical protein
MKIRRRLQAAIGLLAVLTLVLGACGSSDSSSEGGGDTTEATGTSQPEGDGTASGDTIKVPEDHETIQDAVDAAKPGDLILVGEGTYNEAVDVTTDDLVIRGVDRNEVILDGEFELENGIRVLDADGVAVENMTARNYTRNGFFWTTNIDGYRGSYLTALRNGDYGIYAFGARNGLLEHSYAAGSPDAGFYIGQCYPCNAVISDVVAEYNGLGYSGTNSGGDLYIVSSTWRFNRAGIVPNSGSYEGCAPERETTVVGNIVHNNSNGETPAISAAKDAQGNGIITPGGLDNVIERNLVYDHDIAGIALVPFPESEPINGIPDPPDDDCLADAIPASEEDAADLPDELYWPASGNVVRGNVITDSRVADIIVAAFGPELNEFCDNEISSSIPADLQTVSPCGAPAGVTGEGVATLLEQLESGRPESVPYEEAEWPDPPAQENMPDADTAPAVPAGTPEYPDVDAIALPAMPADEG